MANVLVLPSRSAAVDFPDFEIIDIEQEIASSPELSQRFSGELSPTDNSRAVVQQPVPGFWETISTNFKSAQAAVLSYSLNYLQVYTQRKRIAVEAEEAFKTGNSELMKALHEPGESSISNNPAALQKLENYFYGTRPRADIKEFHNMIIAGENIAKALFSPNHVSGQDPRINHNDNSFNISCNSYTTRALSWYMMASAAAQDIYRGSLDSSDNTSDMLDSGSFIMRDPENRIYNFLTSNPDAYKRISTHFAERMGHNETLAVAGGLVSQPSQNGIEDYTRSMPCGGGTILFDKLTPGTQHNEGELFVKFESTGVPPLVDSTSPSDRYSQYIASAAALGHQFEHSTSFLATRFNSGGQAENIRQEHLYKGALSHVFSSVKALFEGNEASVISKKMKSHGLPAAIAAVKALIKKATEEGNAETIDKANAVLNLIAQETRKLGLVSDQYGIERRGAEVHITLSPDQVLRNIDNAALPVANSNNSSAEDLLNSHDIEEERPLSIVSEVSNLSTSEQLDSPLINLEVFAGRDEVDIDPASLTAQNGSSILPGDDNLYLEEQLIGSSIAASPLYPHESHIEDDNLESGDNSVASAEEASASASEQSASSDALQDSAPSSPGKIRSFFSWIGGYVTYFTDWVRSLLRI